jgi:hypothetical protein
MPYDYYRMPWYIGNPVLIWINYLFKVTQPQSNEPFTCQWTTRFWKLSLHFRFYNSWNCVRSFFTKQLWKNVGSTNSDLDKTGFMYYCWGTHQHMLSFMLMTLAPIRPLIFIKSCHFQLLPNPQKCFFLSSWFATKIYSWPKTTHSLVYLSTDIWILN